VAVEGFYFGVITILWTCGAVRRFLFLYVPSEASLDSDSHGDGNSDNSMSDEEDRIKMPVRRQRLAGHLPNVNIVMTFY